MPASILPARSPPTSAAFVKMPPPTRANSAMEEAPKLNPATMVASSKMIHRTTAPRMPMPTTLMPMTPPLEKATRSARFSPTRAAAAVRVFARTAMYIPMIPVSPEDSAPTR